MSIDYEKIRQLVDLTEKNQLAELTVEEDGLSITIKAEVAVEPPSALMQVVHIGPQAETAPEHAPASPQLKEAPEPEAELSGEHIVQIKSPMIGVFYRNPSPDSPPYADVGDEIEVGQTIGLIEAMKVFSEVPSEVAGRIVSMPIGNAKLVQQDEVLAVVDTSLNS